MITETVRPSDLLNVTIVKIHLFYQGIRLFTDKGGLYDIMHIQRGTEYIEFDNDAVDSNVVLLSPITGIHCLDHKTDSTKPTASLILTTDKGSISYEWKGARMNDVPLDLTITSYVSDIDLSTIALGTMAYGNMGEEYIAIGRDIVQGQAVMLWAERPWLEEEPDFFYTDMYGRAIFDSTRYIHTMTWDRGTRVCDSCGHVYPEGDGADSYCYTCNERSYYCPACLGKSQWVKCPSCERKDGGTKDDDRL